MLTLDGVSLTDQTTDTVPISALGDSHGVSREAVRMYERFYGLRHVARHSGDLSGMLASALRGALARFPDASERYGQLVYCKTQTHNTFSDRDWLRGLADDHGLSRWDVGSLSMTSCASGLALVHFANTARADEPLIVLTGEKAFHPSVARLSVGLLAEVLHVALVGGRIRRLGAGRRPCEPRIGPSVGTHRHPHRRLEP